MARESAGGDDSIIRTLHELEDHQSSSFHSEGQVEKPVTLAIHARAALAQGSVVCQGERTFNVESSIHQAEEMLFNTDDLKIAEIEFNGHNLFTSLPRTQGIYEDYAEIQNTRIESEDITQQCGGQSFVAQLRLQAIGRRQTTEFYGTNSDAKCQQFPTVSTTTYCEDKGKYNLTSSWRKDRGHKVTTSRSIRQQLMPPSQFAPHRVSPTSSTGE
jgi:hypothetical protein